MKTALTIQATRPVIAVAGTIRNDVSADLISLTYDERLNRVEVTLNNWNAETAAFKYSDGSLLLPKTRLAVYVDSGGSNSLIFDGAILSFGGNFPADAPSTLTLVATEVGRPVARTQVNVSWGAALREFFPVLKGRVIRCTGVTEGNPDIRQQTLLNVSGAGHAFSQGYTVSATTHVFDVSRGYRTLFDASARLPAVR